MCRGSWGAAVERVGSEEWREDTWGLPQARAWSWSFVPSELESLEDLHQKATRSAAFMEMPLAEGGKWMAGQT